MSGRTGGGKEVLTTAAVAVGVGVGVAALAGLGLAGAALGAGVLSASAANSFTRRAKPPLQPADVKRDEQCRILNWPQLLKAVQHGGVAPELRAELWPLLLGVFSSDSTEAQRDRELERLRRLYIKLVLVCRELDSQLQTLRSAAIIPSQLAANGGSSGGGGNADAGTGTDEDADAEAGTAGDSGAPAYSAMSAASEAGSASVSGAACGGLERRSPLPLPGNLAAFAEAHRIIVMDAVRTDLRRGASGIGGSGSSGIAGPTVTVLPVACGDGLPELMLVNPPPESGPGIASTEAELAAIGAEPGVAAAEGRLPCWRSQLAGDMLWGAAHLDEPTRRQMLRLVNLLSAYSVHDPETGYCQGMSDLASIFVQLFEDDALAFACFERLMRSARRNFKHDETGIRHQLHQIARVLRDTDPSLYAKLQQLGAEDCMFAYRMVVVMLRRELPPAACCTLWEMQWAVEAAAEAEAVPAAHAAPLPSLGSSSSADVGSRGPAGQAPPQVQEQQEQQQAANGSEAGAAQGSVADAAPAAEARGSLQSTLQGLAEATANARAAGSGSAAAAAGSGSGSESAQPVQPVQRTASGKAAGGGGREQDPPEFVLQFIAAVVRAQRGKIMTDCSEHDDVLRLFNSLHIDFWTAVAQARKQHRAYTQGAAVMQRL